MNRLFGRSKPTQPQQSLGDTVTNIDTRVEVIEKKINQMNTELCKLKDQMEKCTNKSGKDLLKQKALRILRQKKVYENQINNLRDQSFNIGQMDFAIQTVKDAKNTVTAMKAGVGEFKKAYKNINLGNIEDLQDDMMDYMQQADEIQEVLGTVGNSEYVDDADLEAEFAGLDFGVGTSETFDASDIPSVPSTLPDAQSSVQLDEFGLPQTK